MNIGFIGIGQVGGTIAKKLGSKGHSIFLAARNPNQSDALDLKSSIGANAQIESIAQTIEKSEIIFLATPFSAVDSIIKDYGKNLEGKILIDCTNPLKPDLSGLIYSGETSGGEYLQNALSKTFVIKAFNSVGFNIMADPNLESRKAVMYFCGNNEGARHKTSTLIQEVGFQAVDAGDISSCRLIEAFALLWIKSAYKFGMGRDFAFTIIKRK